RAALIEEAARDVDVAKPHVHVTEAQQRSALQPRIVAAPPLFQHAVEGIEGRGEITLRREGAAQTVERANLAARVRNGVVERSAAAIVNDRAAEIPFHVLNVPRV